MQIYLITLEEGKSQISYVAFISLKFPFWYEGKHSYIYIYSSRLPRMFYCIMSFVLDELYTWKRILKLDVIVLLVYDIN